MEGVDGCQWCGEWTRKVLWREVRGGGRRGEDKRRGGGEQGAKAEGMVASTQVADGNDIQDKKQASDSQPPIHSARTQTHSETQTRRRSSFRRARASPITTLPLQKTSLSRARPPAPTRTTKQLINRRALQG